MPNKFETIGVQKQIEASSISDANMKFRLSCKSCAMQHNIMSCNMCTISSTHELVLASLSELQDTKIQHNCCENGCTTDQYFDIYKCPIIQQRMEKKANKKASDVNCVPI